MTLRTRPRRPRRSTLAAAAITIVALVSGCSVLTVDPTPVPTAPAPAASPTTGSTAAPTTCTNPLASYAPVGRLPKAGQMPARSTMRTIQDRGRLIAGVSADTYLLGSRNPFSGQIEGFDIDMVKAVAKAIFGNENAYELKVITAAQRIPALQDGSVDLVARNMTISCDRWTKIAFSSEYYRSGQKILVRRGSDARTLADLSGQEVCAPNATSSMQNLITLAPDAIAVGSDSHTGCLVLFQQGEVAAITGDDTVLAGLAAQDPYAEVPVQKAFTSEPYGLGMNADDVDLVRFVNGRLQQLRTNGEWTRIYNRWLSMPLGRAPAPPRAAYGRTS